jgi:hypothetical protein
MSDAHLRFLAHDSPLLMKLHRLFGHGLLVSLLAACNCDDPLLTVVDDDAGVPALDLGVEDVGFPPVDAGFPDSGDSDSGVPEARVLNFDGTSPITLYLGANRDLGFFLRTPAGAAVPNEVVRFVAAGSGGTLAAAMATTDGTGRAVVRFNAGNTAGMSMVTASADRAPNVIVAIDVREDPASALLLQVNSSARLPVPTANARIYLGAAGVVPTCAQLLAAANLPAATLTANLIGLPASRTFTGLISGQLVTAYVTGENARGETIARGCSDGTRLAGGGTTTVQVNLQQLPSVLVGDYDVLLQLDLAQTLPPPLDETLVTLTDFLSDPAGWAIYQVLAALDDSVGTNFVEWNPPGGGPARPASFAEVRANAGLFNTWRIASIALDDFLVQQLGQDYIDFTNLGDDIAGAIRHFDVGARITLTSSGTPDRLVVHEAWQAIVLEWSQGCPAGDLGCARRAYPIAGANAILAPVEATYGARVNHVPQGGETERFELALDAHTMDLQYGSLVLFLLNSVVFPSLPPPLNGNSLGQVIGNLVGCVDIANSLVDGHRLPGQLLPDRLRVRGAGRRHRHRKRDPGAQQQRHAQRGHWPQRRDRGVDRRRSRSDHRVVAELRDRRPVVHRQPTHRHADLGRRPPHRQRLPQRHRMCRQPTVCADRQLPRGPGGGVRLPPSRGPDRRRGGLRSRRGLRLGLVFGSRDRRADLLQRLRRQPRL